VKLDPPPIRLRPIDIDADVERAVAWYSDPEVLHDSEGEGTEPYPARTVRGMYTHLSQMGEVSVIEVWHGDEWIAVGDAALCPSTTPIVIGAPAFRSRGIGAVVLDQLITRARVLGWTEMHARKVFAYNKRSLRLFTSAGFVEVGRSTDDDGRATIQLRLDLGQHPATNPQCHGSQE
jgi:GNAT superfamily N-acetyltransferase